MAKRKPSGRDYIGLSLPDKPPQLPQEMIDRFPAAAKWEDQWTKWWEGVVRTLGRRDADIESRLTKFENP